MDITEWLEEQECDLLHMIEDWFESRDGKEDIEMAAPKNSAFTQGEQAARGYLLHTITITEKEWKALAEQYAVGHVSTPAACRHFEEGWLTVSPRAFAGADQVVLQVKIMNIYPDSLKEQKQMTPPEKEMYDLFGAWSTIEFLDESKVCFTYLITTSCAVVNRSKPCQFLRQKQVSYKIVTPKRSIEND